MRVSRFLLLSTIQPDHIKNINVPVCRNCIHHIPNKYYNYTSTFSKCAKFGEKDIISGHINNHYTEHCRDNENMCGVEGKYFEQDPEVEKKHLILMFAKQSKIIIFIYIFQFHFILVL
jgi:hypothetical protein